VLVDSFLIAAAFLSILSFLSNLINLFPLICGMLTPQPQSALRAKALLICRLLEKEYGRPESRKGKPMDILIRTILSQNTSDTNSDRAFDALKKRYKDWDSLLKADTKEIARTIRAGGLANIKAKRIKKALIGLKAKSGKLSLDFLKGMEVEDALSFLRSLHGIGPKTAAVVLCFGFGMPTLPVDTHVFRVSSRLGLLGELDARKKKARISLEKAHGLLREIVPEKFVVSFHLNMIEHGRTICRAQRPKCHQCVLRRDCDYFAYVVEK
jgi:endonuclease-3